MSVWERSVGLGLFGSFTLIKITTLELRGPEWGRLVAEAIMWLGWAALVGWAAKAADRRRERRFEADQRRWLDEDAARERRTDHP